MAGVAAFLFLAAAGTAGGQEPPLYLALGDSLSFGIGASNPGKTGFVAVVQESLAKSDRFRKTGLDLENLGFPGATSSDLLIPGGQLDQALAAIKEREEDGDPDNEVEVITIEIGGNDLLSLISGDSPCVREPLEAECQQRFSDVMFVFRKSFTKVMTDLRQAAPQAQIVAITLFNPFSGTGNFLEAGADLAVAQLNAVVTVVATSSDVGALVADTFYLFRGRGPELIAADGIHPNDEGYRLMAEAVLAALDEAAPLAGEENGGNPGLLLAIVIPSVVVGLAVIGGVLWQARIRSRQTG